MSNEEKQKFTITEVSKLLNIEAYVLRYYEQELNIEIARNKKKHRIYTLEDIEMFKKIKNLREEGFELKALKSKLGEEGLHDKKTNRLDEIEETVMEKEKMELKALDKMNGIDRVDIASEDDEKVTQFALLMKETLKQALVEHSYQTKLELKEEISDEMSTMIDMRIDELKREEKLHFKKIDEQLRELRELNAIKSELAAKETKKEKVSFLKKIFKPSAPNTFKEITD